MIKENFSHTIYYIPVISGYTCYENLCARNYKDLAVSLIKFIGQRKLPVSSLLENNDYNYSLMLQFSCAFI